MSFEVRVTFDMTLVIGLGADYVNRDLVGSVFINASSGPMTV